MNMQRKVLLGCGMAICVVSLASFAAYKYALSLTFGSIMDVPPSLIKSKSPTNLGIAAFLRDEAFSNYSAYFYVLDTAKSVKPIFVGGPYASDGNVKMQNAIWSKDGSVVAVRAKVGETAGHKFSKYFGEFFVDAYDFRKHKTIGIGASVRQKSQLIKGLVTQRGGQGKIALSSPNAFTANHQIGEQEAKQFKR
jgi:hypothetical protein